MGRWWCLAALALVAGCAGGSGAAPEQPLAVAGMLHPAGRAFVRTYCAACHWRGGRDPDQPRGHQVLPLDTYQEWRSGLTVIAAVLDRWQPDGRVMPPPEADPQPTDAERRLILDWIARGAPNEESASDHPVQ